MNRKLAIQVIQELLHSGVSEFVLCPGGRNAPLVNLITRSTLKHTCWFEERSAAFYALGRARALRRPVAVITTSGTAVGELLPACMEAYYSSIPLVLVTADRPRSYRGTNAPQTADQVGIFGIYAPTELDLAGEEHFSLASWSAHQPLHLNVCFEEPTKDEAPFTFESPQRREKEPKVGVDPSRLCTFIERADKLLIIVGALQRADRESTIRFLVRCNAPVYLEAISGIREDPRLSKLRVIQPRLKDHKAILRLGGVPTHRIWRDLEDASVEVLSITEHPFGGLARGDFIHADIGCFLDKVSIHLSRGNAEKLLEREQALEAKLTELLLEEPTSEQGMIHALSLALPTSSQVYLGNSLPIREWDMVASSRRQFFDVLASRGLNGIDGQLSTFFGLCKEERLNVALVGDLTALYDMAAPWCLQYRPEIAFALCVINNRGGRIFQRRFVNEAIQNIHQLQFAPIAEFWGVPYQQWDRIPEGVQLRGIIELVPDLEATTRFWEQWEVIQKANLALAYEEH